jgi:putative ABC transport system substrate-binding protein
MAILFPHIRTLVRLLLCTATVFAFYAPGSPSSAAAADMVVIRSADLKPYKAAIRGFRDACGCDVREAALQDGERVKTILSNGPAVVVAVGTAAFMKVRSHPDKRIVYLMVMPSEVPSALEQSISGVGMDPSPSAYLAAMNETVPLAKRVGLLYDPKLTGPFVREAQLAAKTAGMELVVRPVEGLAAMPSALDSLRGKADIIWMLPDPTVVTPDTVELLLRFSFEQNVPVISFSRKYVEMGAMASLDVDPYDMGAQAAGIAGRLSAGGMVGPIREPARVTKLFINAHVVKKMGLSIREKTLKKAVIID